MKDQTAEHLEKFDAHLGDCEHKHEHLEKNIKAEVKKKKSRKVSKDNLDEVKIDTKV